VKPRHYSQVFWSQVTAFYRSNRFLKRIVVFNHHVPLEPCCGTLYFDDSLEQGRTARKEGEIRKRMERATEEDLVTLVYTSGTTGKPKGVMLTHANTLFQKEAHDRRLIDPNESDVSLCFLPLSHIFERCWTYYALATGMENNYLDDPAGIQDTVQEVRPAIMCAVPRFYEKIYAAVNNRLEVASPSRQKLFRWAVQVGAEYGNRRKNGNAVVCPDPFRNGLPP